LHCAIKYNKFDCVSVLVLAGADMSPGHHNKSPLHMAVKKGNTVVAIFLILHGCDTDLLNNNGLTALQLCMTTKMTETLQDAIREVRETRLSALMMGHHDRLGQRSWIRSLPADLIREIFEKRH
jgi:hypothetical protein